MLLQRRRTMIALRKVPSLRLPLEPGDPKELLNIFMVLSNDDPLKLERDYTRSSTEMRHR